MENVDMKKLIFVSVLLVVMSAASFMTGCGKKDAAGGSAGTSFLPNVSL
jgi:hypothetical protein